MLPFQEALSLYPLEDGDLMVYERNTHFAYFMRGTELLPCGTVSNRIDLGQLRISDLKQKADEIGEPFGLVAELTNEKIELCIFKFKKRHRL